MFDISGISVNNNNNNPDVLLARVILALYYSEGFRNLAMDGDEDPSLFKAVTDAQRYLGI